MFRFRDYFVSFLVFFMVLLISHCGDPAGNTGGGASQPVTPMGGVKFFFSHLHNSHLPKYSNDGQLGL